MCRMAVLVSKFVRFLLLLALLAFCNDWCSASANTLPSVVSARLPTLKQRHKPLVRPLRGGSTVAEDTLDATSAPAEDEPVVIGIDGGTESIRAGIFRANGTLVSVASSAYTTTFPKPGWAEQNAEDWWRCLGEAVRGALVKAAAAEAGGEDEVALEAIRTRVQALCVDTTCCTVVALDADGNALRPALLWMDSRSAPQAKQILKDCKGMSALSVNCDGEGPLSAEWMLPKSLWLKQEDPEVWDKAATICEFQDYINLKLTGRLCASSCNSASRWHWDGEACIHGPTQGRPLELLDALGIPELAAKWPQECLAMGSLVGGLTTEAAAHLGLREGLRVAQGGPDAFVGMLGDWGVGCGVWGVGCGVWG